MIIPLFNITAVIVVVVAAVVIVHYEISAFAGVVSALWTAKLQEWMVCIVSCAILK